MTIEAVLLLVLFVTVALAAFTKPGATFHDYGPRLGARLENHLSVGQSFTVKNPSGGAIGPLSWEPQIPPPPEGKF